VGPIISLSKYIHVRYSFEEFIEINLMVQSEFNLVFFCLWVITFFKLVELVDPATGCDSRACISPAPASYAAFGGAYGRYRFIATALEIACAASIAWVLQYPVRTFSSCKWWCGWGSGWDPVPSAEGLAAKHSGAWDNYTIVDRSCCYATRKIIFVYRIVTIELYETTQNTIYRLSVKSSQIRWQ
jgi:hypothetical protein